MISNVKFGKNQKSRFIKKTTAFYVYDNLVETTFIVGSQTDWLGIETDIVAILSHETLHKVLFKTEGSIASHNLDKWCSSRKWLYNDDSGICFLAQELD